MIDPKQTKLSASPRSPSNLVVVFGLPRSGTSGWTRRIADLGWQLIGEPFPPHTPTAIRALNPDGFWEGPFRDGWTSEQLDDLAHGETSDNASRRGMVFKAFRINHINLESRLDARLVVVLRRFETWSPSAARLTAAVNKVNPDQSPEATLRRLARWTEHIEEIAQIAVSLQSRMAVVCLESRQYDDNCPVAVWLDADTTKQRVLPERAPVSYEKCVPGEIVEATDAARAEILKHARRCGCFVVE